MRSCLFVFVLIFGVGLTACKKTVPQLPSNKGIEISKDKATLLKINQSLIIKEDSVLKVFAESKGGFKKDGLGFWYNVFSIGNGSIIKDSTLCDFKFTMRKLDGKALETGIKKIVIGKKQSIPGLEEGLKLMHKGDSAYFIIPWYLGYGMKGDESLVQPYTSLVFEVKILN